MHLRPVAISFFYLNLKTTKRFNFISTVLVFLFSCPPSPPSYLLLLMFSLSTHCVVHLVLMVVMWPMIMSFFNIAFGFYWFLLLACFSTSHLSSIPSYFLPVSLVAFFFNYQQHTFPDITVRAGSHCLSHPFPCVILSHRIYLLVLLSSFPGSFFTSFPGTHSYIISHYVTYFLVMIVYPHS